MAALGALVAGIDLPHVQLAEAIGRTIVTIEAGLLREPLLDRIGEYDRNRAERTLARNRSARSTTCAG